MNVQHFYRSMSFAFDWAWIVYANLLPAFHYLPREGRRSPENAKIINFWGIYGFFCCIGEIIWSELRIFFELLSEWNWRNSNHRKNNSSFILTSSFHPLVSIRLIHFANFSSIFLKSQLFIHAHRTNLHFQDFLYNWCLLQTSCPKSSTDARSFSFQWKFCSCHYFALEATLLYCSWLDWLIEWWAKNKEVGGRSGNKKHKTNFSFLLCGKER